MTDIAHGRGVFFKKSEIYDYQKTYCRFNEVLVKDIMTPRAVVKSLLKAKRFRNFSRESKVAPFLESSVNSGKSR